MAATKQEIRKLAIEIGKEIAKSIIADIDNIYERLQKKETLKKLISQNEAYKVYGRAKVNRWHENGQIKRFIKMNGKMNTFEFKVSDLDILSEKQQLLKLK